MPASPDEREMAELLRNIAADITEADLSEMTMDTRLDSLGLDSLDQLELITALEDELSIRIPDEKVKEVETIGGLVSCLLETRAAPSDALR